MRKILPLIVTLAALFLSFGPSRAQDIATIGVLAFQGPSEAMRRWAPIAEYLSEQIEGITFQIVPYELNPLRDAVAQQRVDFVLTNPGHYVRLEHDFGVSALLTLQVAHKGDSHTEFGAVIVARNDRDDIQNLSDLKGKSFGIVSVGAFGGFKMAWREMLDAGVDPFSDLGDLVSFGFPQDAIVMAVRDGRIDAGTVRTGVLEKLIERGFIGANELKVLNGQDLSTTFDLVHSTRLYPEWPLAKLTSTRPLLAKRVAQSLLSLPRDHPAAIAARLWGWTIPASYQPVHELLRTLKVTPYEEKPLSFSDVLKVYTEEILAFFGILLILITTSSLIYRGNRRLRASQRQLADYRDHLEAKVYERTEELSQTNETLQKDIARREKVERRLEKSRAALQEIYDISIAPNSHGDRIRKLMGLGASHLGGTAAYLFASGIEKPLFSNLLGPMQVEARVFEAAQQIAMDPANVGAAAIEKNLGRLDRVIATPFLSSQNEPLFLIFAGLTEAIEPEDYEILNLVSGIVAAELAQQFAEDQSLQHQAHLSRVGRVTTVGQMASGLSHEINQPLTQALNYVNGTLRRVRAGVADSEKIEEGLVQTVASIERATNIIQSLRTLLRSGEPEKKRFDLCTAIRNVVHLCGGEIRQKRIALDLMLEPALIEIKADRVQIEQIILNLLRNAIEAVSTGGMIRVQAMTSADYVWVRIEDNGGGLQSENPDQLFEPFYSTKGSAGMGLGLSICRNIARAHNGDVLASTSGNYAIFTLELPLKDQSDDIEKDDDKDE